MILRHHNLTQHFGKVLQEKVLQAQGLKPEPVVRPMTEQTLRTDGCEEVNRMLHSIATEVADVPAVGSDKKLPPSYQSITFIFMFLMPMQPEPASPSKSKSPVSPGAVRTQTETRLQWRNKMDNSLRRLMLNMELDGLCAPSPQLRNDLPTGLQRTSFPASCHVALLEDWYNTHGGKEVRKDAQRATAPAFVRYNQDGPVMPGSLRVPKTPKLDKQKAPAKKDVALPGLSRGVSSPALVAAGTLNVESPANSPCPSPKAKAAR
eukprot:s1781_g4.t1